MKKAYLLGDGLKKGNQILRNMERTALNELGTLEPYNPWDQKDINDKRNNPTAEAIFKKDTEAILQSEIIVADADNDSVGSTCEIGQIWGLNYMHKRIKEIMDSTKDDSELRDKLEALLEEVPYKEVYWQCTDVRNVDTTESGLRRSYSLNQYLYGCLLDLAGEDKTFEEILEILKDK